VSHGIEKIEERQTLNKPEVGVIELATAKKEDNFELIFSDDGRGIQFDKLREKALASERWDANEINQWDEAKIADLIFESGISTADGVDKTSGRGVGMDSVRERVENQNGKITINSKPGEYTHFHIFLPLPTEN
jgi:two-component system chemotaxis sensor kinase CheA